MSQSKLNWEKSERWPFGHWCLNTPLGTLSVVECKAAFCERRHSPFVPVLSEVNESDGVRISGHSTR